MIKRKSKLVETLDGLIESLKRLNGSDRDLLVKAHKKSYQQVSVSSLEAENAKLKGRIDNLEEQLGKAAHFLDKKDAELASKNEALEKMKKMLDHNSKSNQKLNAKNMKLESDMAIALEGLQEITKLKSEVGRPYQTGGVAIHIAKETLLSLIDNKAKQALEKKDV